MCEANQVEEATSSDMTKTSTASYHCQQNDCEGGFSRFNERQKYW